MAARVRVFLLTFRRPALLPRALDSLLRQTCRDWFCELHNGDPSDAFPAELVARISDPRIKLVVPPHRTGPVEAFNLAHQPVPEEFQSILEDDNWWEPEFLEQMLQAMDAHSEAELGWSNMRYWNEQEDGSWSDTHRTVWQTLADRPTVIFRWPHLIQFNDFLYSNGAMMLRSRSAARLIMPAFIPHDMIEHTRERMMAFPILLVTAPIANFAVTRGTFRSKAYSAWGRTQALLGAAFLLNVPMSVEAQKTLWQNRRRSIPRSTNALVFAAVVARQWRFLRHATLADWYAFLRGLFGHPQSAWAVLRARKDLPETWQFICRETAARTAESTAVGFTELGADTVIEKQSLQ